jgi:hypothetical protein
MSDVLEMKAVVCDKHGEYDRIDDGVWVPFNWKSHRGN